MTPALHKAVRLLPAILILGIGGWLLFASLGVYALWDDEALTALIARGVARTGDTVVEIDHNIVGFRGGLLIKDMRDRSTPPLCEYLAAPFVAFAGESALAARLPFAILGFFALLVTVIWFWKARISQTTQWLALFVLLGNVSLFLYFRQCRYYAPAIFLTFLIMGLHVFGGSSRWKLLLMAALSILLFSANYLSYLALYVCLAVDYVIWRRKELRLNARDWLALLGPQIIGCGLIALVWNPLYTNYSSYLEKSSLADRVILFLWNWRDMNHCEFFSGLVLAAAIVAGIVMRDRWLLRGSLALLVYTVFICSVSPQILKTTTVADVRYLVPLIPLFIAMQVRFLSFLAIRNRTIAFLLAAAGFGTNLLNGGPLLARGFHCTIYDYSLELLNPNDEPYTPAVRWIKDHIKPGRSIFVLPDYMVYSLMFHAPHAVYSWQFDHPAGPAFAELPSIHFKYQDAPDYLIAFGPSLGGMAREVERMNRPVEYSLVKRLDHLGIPLFRPELFWRTFKPVPDFDKRSHAIYLFERTKPPLADGRTFQRFPGRAGGAFPGDIPAAVVARWRN